MKSMIADNCVIAIAAFNEEKNISIVVSRIIQTYPNIPVLVIDDGSEDNTAKHAADSGALVVKHPFNMGIGSARNTGYKYALENNYKYLIQIDGDGQHDPESIEELFKRLEDNHIVNGSRFLTGNYKMPLLRSAGRRFFCSLFKIFFRTKITDPTSGYRLLTKDAMKFLLKYDFFDYPEIESLEVLLRFGYKVTEAQVKMEPRLSGKSSIDILHAIYYMIKVSISFFIITVQKGSK